MEIREVKLLPLLFFLLARGFWFRWSVLPPHPLRHPSGTPGLTSLFPRPQLLVVGTVHFPLDRVLEQDDPSRHAASVRKTLRKNTSVVRG
jgi:hypothetical protein